MHGAPAAPDAGDGLRRVEEALGQAREPGGAFYAFVEIPEKLGMTGEDVFEAGIERNLLVIPGGVFSSRDTHFRVSYATNPERLREGLAILADVLS